MFVTLTIIGKVLMLPGMAVLYIASSYRVSEVPRHLKGR
jgi:hypothetical protein